MSSIGSLPAPKGTGSDSSGSSPSVPILKSPPLKMPVDGVEPESMKGGFAERRAGHPHEAVDLLAPRNTPVRAVDDGTIAKLFVSKAGGNTIYQFNRTGDRSYYYAHLERYAAGLRDGDVVKRGQVIGYVGTSGNAPASTPHLHFAVFELNGERQWWKGRAIDPYPLFKLPGPTEPRRYPTSGHHG
jgi:peptidoglycan LD-endopeptidase LytH